MRAHVQELIEAAAKKLAGRSHTVDEMHDALYQLAIDLRAPACLDDYRPSRRMPLANEVLPPHQRATWARRATAFDEGNDAP